MIELEIGGKKRKFSFGLEVLGKIQLDTGINFLQLAESVDTGNFFLLMKPIIFRSHEWALKEDGKVVDITIEDVDHWLEKDGLYTKNTLKLWDAFSETLISFLPKQGNSEGPKKK